MPSRPRVLAFSLLSAVAGLSGCERTRRAPVPAASTPSASASASASARPSATVSAEGPVTPASPPTRLGESFRGVLPLSRETKRVFAAGKRALVSKGPRFVGWFESHGDLREGGVPSAGLAAAGRASEGAGEDAPLLVAGSYPRLAVVHGHYAGSGSDVRGFRVLSLEGGVWRHASPSAFDRPAGLAPHGAGFVVFDPNPFYGINGVLELEESGPVYRCAPGEGPVAAMITRLKGAPSFKVPRDTFLVDLAADGSGRLVAVGYSMCKPGAVAFRVAEGKLVSDTLPGTEACTDRATATGLPLVSVRVFPGDGAAAWALAWATREEGADEGDGGRPCLATPLLLQQSAEGAWSVAARLPPFDAGRHVLVDRGGDVFVARPASPKGAPTVLRIAKSGAASELTLAPECGELAASKDAGADDEELPRPEGPPEIGALWAPFAGDVWVEVSWPGDGRSALCRARVARP